jgi:hypothetical protein
MLVLAVIALTQRAWGIVGVLVAATVILFALLAAARD